MRETALKAPPLLEGAQGVQTEGMFLEGQKLLGCSSFSNFPAQFRTLKWENSSTCVTRLSLGPLLKVNTTGYSHFANIASNPELRDIYIVTTQPQTPYRCSEIQKHLVYARAKSSHQYHYTRLQPLCTSVSRVRTLSINNTLANPRMSVSWPSN